MIWHHPTNKKTSWKQWLYNSKQKISKTMLPILRLHANYGVHKFFRIEYTYFEINKLLICQNKNALFTLYTHDLLSATRSWQLSRIFLKIACLLLVIYVHIRKYGDCNTLKYHNTSRCEAEECTVYWSGEHYKVSLSTDRSGLDVAIFFFYLRS